MNEVKFIYNEPAAICGDFLIVSDIHLGARGMRDVQSTIEIVKRMLEEHKKNKLLILGDLMADYSKVDEEAGIFIRNMSKHCELHIVKGNHDGGIEKYRDFCTIYGSEGGIIKNVGFFHGHAWPKKEIFEKEIILMGHVHPKVILGKECKWVEKTWIVSQINEKKIKEKYEGIKINKNNKIYVFPSFGVQGISSISGGTLMKEYESQRVTGEIFIKDTSQIYLLNGIKIK